MRIKIDKNGVITLPLWVCSMLQLNEGEVELEILSDSIKLRKPVNGCIFCKSAVTLLKIGDFFVCEACRKRLANAPNGDYLYVNGID